MESVAAMVMATTLLCGGSDAREIDLNTMRQAEAAIEAAIERQEIPGAVLLVGTSDRVLYRKAFGFRSIEPVRMPMTLGTVFDMASLTKPIATATAVMTLVDRGQVDVKERVATYLPTFGVNGKESITVEQLLLHWGGLVPDNPMSDYEDGPVEAMERVMASKPKWEPGGHFAYSDVGFIVLAELVEAVDGRPLDRFVREEIFGPLKMRQTMFKPTKTIADQAAPTEKRNGQWAKGEVHDPRAYALGGVAGHAGLFSTADDVARWCQMILNGGELEGTRVLSEATLQAMTEPRTLPDGTGCRGYGFDIDTPFSSARGDTFEPRTTFGHTGFTGTSLWIDPKHDAFVVLLTNRVHPDGKGKVVDLRREVTTHAAAAVLGGADEARDNRSAANTTASPSAGVRAQGAPAEVRTGIDILVREQFKSLEGQRVGLITNHTGIDRQGRRTVDLLRNAKNVNLVKLFSPEHGLYGLLDEKVGDTMDQSTGLKVYSLYGENRRPTEEMLEGIDTLVFDIQDIGTRFYTYISTMGLAMEEAAKHGIRFVVLDRPNPITGVLADGPIADEKHLGFTAYRPIPLVHGMTIGELAMLFNDHFDINCDLNVVKVENWRRAMWWDETGLRWVNPSPNMRNLTQALLYPGVGLLESSNISVGRGTDQPFELFGAPWIDDQKLAAALNAAELPGLRFVPIRFTPDASKFANQECGGVYLIVTDRATVEPVRAGVAMAWHLKRLFGEDFEIGGVLRMLQNDAAYESLQQATQPEEVAQTWEKPLEEFLQLRAKYLLYE